jgi:hypothetical protein
MLVSMCRYWARVLLEQEGSPHSGLGGTSKAGVRQAAFGADESEAKPVGSQVERGVRRHRGDHLLDKYLSMSC